MRDSLENAIIIAAEHKKDELWKKKHSLATSNSFVSLSLRSLKMNIYRGCS